MVGPRAMGGPGHLAEMRIHETGAHREHEGRSDISRDDEQLERRRARRDQCIHRAAALSTELMFSSFFLGVREKQNACANPNRIFFSVLRVIAAR